MKWATWAALVLLAVAGATPAGAKEKGSNRSRVIQAALARYPQAELVGFAQEREGSKTFYEVALQTSQGPLELRISAKGKILEEARPLAQGELPEALQKSLAAAGYAQAQVVRAERIVPSAAPQTPRFELLVEQAGAKRALRFDADGTLTGDEVIADPPPGGGDENEAVDPG